LPAKASYLAERLISQMTMASLSSDNVPEVVILAIVGLLCAFAISTPAQGATYYVDSANGDDSALGTSAAQPWKTLAKINGSHFQPGDQVLLARDRSWLEQLKVPSSGADGAPLTFGSYGSGQQPVIDAQSIRNRGISIVGKSNVVVNDLGVRNSTSLSIEVFNSSHIVVTNCTIKNSKGTAIGVGGLSPDFRVDGCSYSLDPQFSTVGSFISVFSPVDGAVVINNKAASFTGHIAIAFMDVNNAVAYGNVIDGGGIAIAINACSRNLTGAQIHDNILSNTSSAEGDGETIELTGHVGAANAHCEQDKAHPFPVFSVTAEVYGNRIQGGPDTFGGIDGWHAVQCKVHDNRIQGVRKYGMQWTAGSTENEFFHNEIRNSGVAGIAVYGGSGRSSAAVHHNIIEGAGVGISGDPGAEVTEDYNTVNRVKAARSISIPAGSHTTESRTPSY
jgi:hypothetical protein